MTALADAHARFLARVVGSADPDAAPELVGDERASALERLAVYRHAFVARIAEALLEDFPALGATLGSEAFTRAATDYSRAEPSRDPSLRTVGERLPGFLEAHESAAELRAGAPWSPALARLEWALRDVFDAPDCDALTRQAVAALAPERWDSLDLALIPAARLLVLPWPVRRLRAAWAAGEPPPPPPSAAALERVLVWRKEERVFHRELEAEEAALLERVARGVSFGALCTDAAAARGEAAGAAYAASALARWIEDGVLRA